MKVFMISGSRNPEGRTSQCCRAIAKGLTKAGAISEGGLPSNDEAGKMQTMRSGWMGHLPTRGQVCDRG